MVVGGPPEKFAGVRPGLQEVPLMATMAPAGAPKTSASGWRSGRTIPNMRHLEALAGLVSGLRNGQDE